MCVCICMYVCINIYVCIYIYICIYIHVYMFMHMYMCMYIHRHITFDLSLSLFLSYDSHALVLSRTPIQTHIYIHILHM